MTGDLRGPVMVLGSRSSEVNPTPERIGQSGAVSPWSSTL